MDARHLNDVACGPVLTSAIMALPGSNRLICDFENRFRVADHTLRITLRDNLALTDIDGQIELQYLACR